MTNETMQAAAEHVDELREAMYLAAFAVALDVKAERAPDPQAVARFVDADAAYQAAVDEWRKANPETGL